MKTFNYNGRSFEYNEATVTFSFELGRFENAYKAIKYFSAHDEAIDCYEMYHVSNGYKKRLKMGNIVIAKKLTNRDL